MRKWWSTIQWRSAALCGLLLAALYSPAAWAEENPAGRAYLREVYKAMDSIHSTHYDMEIKGDSLLGDLQVAARGDLQEKPLKFSQDLRLVYHDTVNKETLVEIKQCGEADADNLVLYMLVNREWVKQTVPVGPLVLKTLSESGRAAAREEMLQMVKSVNLMRETSTDRLLEITLDTMKLNDLIEAAVKQQLQKTEDPKQSGDLQKAAALIRMGLLAAGDIKYTVKVDKATKIVKECEMDLTGPIRKGASLFLNMAPKKDQEEIGDFIQKMTLTFKMTYSKYNQASPADVPQEARENAREVDTKTKMTLTMPTEPTEP